MEGVTSYEAAAAVFASYKQQQQKISFTSFSPKRSHPPAAAAAPNNENNYSDRARQSQQTCLQPAPNNNKPVAPKADHKHAPNERLQRR